MTVAIALTFVNGNRALSDDEKKSLKTLGTELQRSPAAPAA